SLGHDDKLCGRAASSPERLIWRCRQTLYHWHGNQEEEEEEEEGRVYRHHKLLKSTRSTAAVLSLAVVNTSIKRGQQEEDAEGCIDEMMLISSSLTHVSIWGLDSTDKRLVAVSRICHPTHTHHHHHQHSVEHVRARSDEDPFFPAMLLSLGPLLPNTLAIAGGARVRIFNLTPPPPPTTSSSEQDPTGSETLDHAECLKCAQYVAHKMEDIGFT
ncbi:hypothetical protein FOZ63_008466, partial [Perkinsus olseni]